MTQKGQVSGFKPGERAPASGQYQEIEADGSKGREVTTVKGEHFPPTTQKGASYTLVHPSNNKSGKVC